MGLRLHTYTSVVLSFTEREELLACLLSKKKKSRGDLDSRMRSLSKKRKESWAIWMLVRDPYWNISNSDLMVVALLHGITSR